MGFQMMIDRTLAAFTIVTLLAPSPLAAADAAKSPSLVVQHHAPMPSNVEVLDQALKANDYAAITGLHADIRSEDDLILFMNWEQARAFEGGGLYVSYIYMTDLWNLATGIAADRPEAESGAARLKQTAVFMALFNYELIVLDGTKCTDATAVSHRMDQLTTGQAPIWAYVGQIAEPRRREIRHSLLALEAYTAAKRANDQLLCTGAPGTVGRSDDAPAAPPGENLVAPAVWQPQQAKLRAEMPARLGALLKLAPPAAK